MLSVVVLGFAQAQEAQEEEEALAAEIHPGRRDSSVWGFRAL